MKLHIQKNIYIYILHINIMLHYQIWEINPFHFIFTKFKALETLFSVNIIKVFSASGDKY